MGSKRKTTKVEQPPVQTPVPPRETPPHPRVLAARQTFRDANIEFVEGREPSEPWRVVGRFNFLPLSNFWKSDDSQGYGLRELISLIRRQAASPEGVEAVARALDPVTAPHLTDPVDRKIQEAAYDA